jgi:hypothetical protein
LAATIDPAPAMFWTMIRISRNVLRHDRADQTRPLIVDVSGPKAGDNSTGLAFVKRLTLGKESRGE